jgi:hypothetical protein
MVLKFEHVLLGGGIVLAIIGHLRDGTATQEVVFWHEQALSLRVPPGTAFTAGGP